MEKSSFPNEFRGKKFSRFSDEISMSSSSFSQSESRISRLSRTPSTTFSAQLDYINDQTYSSLTGPSPLNFLGGLPLIHLNVFTLRFSDPILEEAYRLHFMHRRLHQLTKRFLICCIAWAVAVVIYGETSLIRLRQKILLTTLALPLCMIGAMILFRMLRFTTTFSIVQIGLSICQICFGIIFVAFFEYNLPGNGIYFCELNVALFGFIAVAVFHIAFVPFLIASSASLTALAVILSIQENPHKHSDFPLLLFWPGILLCSFVLFSYFGERRSRQNFFYTRQRQITEKEYRKQLSALIPEPFLTSFIATDSVRDIHIDFQLFPSVSVLFTHIADFDEIISNWTATEVITLLNEVFCEMDKKVQKYNLFRVETIGDTHLVSGGVPLFVNKQQHASDCISVALEFRKVLDTINSKISQSRRNKNSCRRFHFRSGIHTGEAIAVVIGVEFPRFRLIGSTVNIASRMSSNKGSHSPPPRPSSSSSSSMEDDNSLQDPLKDAKEFIQISTSTFELLDPEEFSLTPRYNVILKGMQPTTTYVVNRKLNQKSASISVNGEVRDPNVNVPNSFPSAIPKVFSPQWDKFNMAVELSKLTHIFSSADSFQMEKKDQSHETHTNIPISQMPIQLDDKTETKGNDLTTIGSPTLANSSSRSSSLSINSKVRQKNCNLICVIAASLTNLWDSCFRVRQDISPIRSLWKRLVVRISNFISSLFFLSFSSRNDSETAKLLETQFSTRWADHFHSQRISTLLLNQLLMLFLNIIGQSDLIISIVVCFASLYLLFQSNFATICKARSSMIGFIVWSFISFTVSQRFLVISTNSTWWYGNSLDGGFEDLAPMAVMMMFITIGSCFFGLPFLPSLCYSMSFLIWITFLSFFSSKPPNQNENTAMYVVYLWGVCVVSWFASRNVEISFRKEFLFHHQLSESMNRNQKLKGALLPAKVWQQVERNPFVANVRPNASILLSDIKDFTRHSLNCSGPHEILCVLNDLFCLMDFLSRKHGVFKVETIGDAYLCCTNVANVDDFFQGDSSKAAIDLVRFALDCQIAAQSLKWPLKLNDSTGSALSPSVSLRIGIHTGNVVAGVVNSSAPRYHLFGKAVRFTERVEENGLADKVIVSQSTQVRISHFFDCSHFGEIDGIKLFQVGDFRSSAWWDSDNNQWRDLPSAEEHIEVSRTILPQNEICIGLPRWFLTEILRRRESNPSDLSVPTDLKNIFNSFQPNSSKLIGILLKVHEVNLWNIQTGNHKVKGGEIPNVKVDKEKIQEIKE